MKRERFQRILSAFAQIEPCGPAVAARVMAGAVARDSSLGDVLPPADPEALNARLWKAFARIIRGSGEFRTLEGPLMALGIEAARRGLNPGHIRLLREEILTAIGELLGEEWTPRARRDWALVLAAVSGAMLRGSIQDATASLAA